MRRSVVWLACFAVIACSAQAGPALAANPPVPTPPPNVPSQKPAFPGQTRAPEITPATKVRYEVMAEGLAKPWGLAFLPDGRLLVTEKPGRLRVLDDRRLSPPVAGIPAVDSAGQGGLLDVAIGPTFARDRLIYWTYSEPREAGKNGTSVARGRLSEDLARVDAVQVIFRQLPSWTSRGHYGSRLVFDRNGHLFVTLGERQLPEPRQLAQDLGAHMGKVVRIFPDGSVPKDNPFVGKAGARPEIWSYGHRNIQGADLHPVTGELWTVEHGARGGDEVNAPKAGKNYGWPIITYGEDYDGSPIGGGITQKAGMEQPIYYWDPVIAPGGARFYRGDLFKGWKNNLLIAGLASNALVRLTLDGEHVTGEERLMLGAGRLREIAEAADGALWIVTDENDGRVIRLVPAP